jgi:hypothetical protein
VSKTKEEGEIIENYLKQKSRRRRRRRRKSLGYRWLLFF